MLSLTRRVGEEIQIGQDVKIRVLSVIGSHVRIGIHAPEKVAIFRTELIGQPGVAEALAASQRLVEVDDA